MSSMRLYALLVFVENIFAKIMSIYNEKRSKGEVL